MQIKHFWSSPLPWTDGPLLYDRKHTMSKLWNVYWTVGNWTFALILPREYIGTYWMKTSFIYSTFWGIFWTFLIGTTVIKIPCHHRVWLYSLYMYNGHFRIVNMLCYPRITLYQRNEQRLVLLMQRLKTSQELFFVRSNRKYAISEFIMYEVFSTV